MRQNSSTARRLSLHESGPSFDLTLRRHGAAPLVRGRTVTLQVNFGKLCNMACHHCHVEAGPKRTEIMGHGVAERVIELLSSDSGVEVVDLTGGAPELNPSFRWLVERARRLGRRVIDRCNLTVLFEPGLEELPEFLAREGVEVVARASFGHERFWPRPTPPGATGSCSIKPTSGSRARETWASAWSGSPAPRSTGPSSSS